MQGHVGGVTGRTACLETQEICIPNSFSIRATAHKAAHAPYKPHHVNMEKRLRMQKQKWKRKLSLQRKQTNPFTPQSLLA